MPPLSPTNSDESRSSNTRRDAACVSREKAESAAASYGRPELERSDRSIGTANRTATHSLLGDSPSNSTSSRKSRFADAGTVGGSVERASLSMPPPTSKPTRSIYRPGASRLPVSYENGSDNATRPSGMDGAKDTLQLVDSTASEDSQQTVDTSNLRGTNSTETRPSRLSDSSLKPPASVQNKEADRRSFVSLYSLGSTIHDFASGALSGTQSAASSSAGSIKHSSPDQQGSLAGSPPLTSSKGENTSLATTATDPVSVTAHAAQSHQGLGALPAAIPTSGSTNAETVPEHSSVTESSAPVQSAASKHVDSWNTGPVPRPSAPRRSRSKTKVQGGSALTSSAASPNSSDRAKPSVVYGKVGVCALDSKARSKACRNILTRLSNGGEFDVIIFGDKVILDEEVKNWPVCDFLISFFSDGFPLDKAVEYSELRKPFCINDLRMQKILWDRRICLRILDSLTVPTPKRLEVNRDGGPTVESPQLAEHVYTLSGVKLEGPKDGTGGGIPITKDVSLIEDGDALVVDGQVLHKPFVEKPVSGEDHNIFIYFPKTYHGGGGRRLFRKIGNKSSEWDKDLLVPRSVTEPNASYLYEKFLHVDNAEDIKAYTVGPDYCHAETRTSPVVDGVVRRNTHGKEIRYICNLTDSEKLMAKKITNGFGQKVCGFDMLRVGDKSYVIDVNGWSFVKDNNAYYDQCASIMKQMFIAEKARREKDAPKDAGREAAAPQDQPNEEHKVDSGLGPRKSTHRSAFKNLIKSPSMSKLRGRHLPGHQASNAPTSDAQLETGTLSSPPTFENEHKTYLPPPPSTSQLPSPALSAESSKPATSTSGISKEQSAATDVPEPESKHAWKLKGMVSVIRHADRTPKQKFKFTFHTEPFVKLLKGHQEEVLLKGEAALGSVMDAVKVALKEGVEDPEKLHLLKTSLARKGAWTGTKVQIKPMFRKRKPEEISSVQNNSLTGDAFPVNITGQDESEEPEQERTLTRPPTRSDSLTATTLSRYSAAENDLVLDKLQLIVKWGGEPTHSARYQSQDLGENMRGDMLLMNKDALEDVHVFTSSERRVSTSAQIWTAAFLNRSEIPEASIAVRKDLLDDSNAAKDVMDKVKKKLKLLLREGHKPDPQFAWPANTPEPAEVVRKVADLMNFHRQVMRANFKRLQGSAAASLKAINPAGDQSGSAAAASTTASGGQPQTLASIQARWCCGEDPELFKERWEKLFSEFCDSEKVDPSKISELYDTMKFDALHNRQFLEWVFTPPTGFIEDEGERQSSSVSDNASSITPPQPSPNSSNNHERRQSGGDFVLDKGPDKTNQNFAHRMGLRRKSVLNPPSPQPHPPLEHQESYFKLYAGTGQTRAKLDARLAKLRELYKYAKVLFDFICPQEYGISDEEKLEIGLLTSLPLLKEIVHDLEEFQASDDAKTFIYFTKESHIYTLLNCILEGGIKTKIERNAIPELDYLSNITFELYESEDRDADTFTYSIRIYITPGCHTFDPLDVQLDSKHSIGCAPRRSLTAHLDWKEVIDTLKSKFQTVKLPKSFLAVNVSGDSQTSDSSSDKASEKVV